MERTPIRVLGRCGWQGRKDEHFLLFTYHTAEGPVLKIPSPLSAADPRGYGIFSNDGAMLSPGCVEALRDQLTAWLGEHWAKP